MASWPSALSAGCIVTLLSSLLVAAQQWQNIPVESTVSARPHTYHRYHVLHNVLLWEDRLHFYVPDELADSVPDESHRAPRQQELNVSGAWFEQGHMGNFQVEVVSRHNRSRFPQTCQRWIDNAVMYSGMGMDTLNYYHTLFDSFGMVFNLVASLNLFNMSDMLARGRAPTREEANLVLIQRHGDSWFNIHGLQLLYDYITPDQWTFPHGAGYCYKTLVVGLDAHLSAYGDALSEEDLQLKIAEMARYAQFITYAQGRIDAAQGVDMPALQELYELPEQQLVISFISRQTGLWNSRAVVNEGELIEGMRQRYPTANVSLIHLEGFPSKSESFLAVGRTDVLIGAHGAGLSNIMFMKPGASVVQLIPYGWRRRNGDIQGEVMFRRIANFSNVTYFMWENQHANNSWLAHGSQRREHPNITLTEEFGQFKDFTPYLMQDTKVELESFLAVVDEAVQAASQSLQRLSSSK